MSFVARFNGVCHRCGEPFTRGERIEYGPNRKVRHARKADCEDARELAASYAIQAAEMRAETFAAEAVMGMAPGTTEGWYDEPGEW